jgi:hypothetical protein
MLKPQKDTIIPAIEIAKKQYQVKLSLATAMYFYMVTSDTVLDCTAEKYDKLKNELMDLKVHIEVLEELAKEAE